MKQRSGQVLGEYTELESIDMKDLSLILTVFSSSRAGALLAPHPDTGFNELQEYSIKKYFELGDQDPRSGVKVSHFCMIPIGRI